MESENRELSRRLLVAILAPVALLVALGVVLGAQILRMSDDAHWLDHSDNVLAQINLARKQIIDEETGLRAFIITGDRLFLDPYEKANPDELINTVLAQIEDNPAQVQRAKAALAAHQHWVQSYARPIIERKTPLEQARTAEAMHLGRMDMDAIRTELQAFVATEEQLRRTRSATSASSSETTRILFFVLFTFSAAFLAFFSRRQLQQITGTYAEALLGERTVRSRLEDEAWTRAGIAATAVAVRGDLDVTEVGDHTLKALAEYVGADVGAFFVADGRVLRRRAGFGLDARHAGAETFELGAGLVGRAAASDLALVRVKVADLEEDGAPKIRGATLEKDPVELLLLPLRVSGTTAGVVELGFLKPPGDRVAELLERVSETIAIGVRSAEYRTRLAQLLEESQQQAEELQTQQEELRVANEELEEQTRAVREAQAGLEERQEELTATNARLAEQAADLQSARESAVEKAEALERASRYKSDFLANMSHELRTPLNSSLILAKLLADNKDGNLSAEQIRFAQTIYAAGNDLLTLINDILDLSKIEAGKMEISAQEVPLGRVAESLRRMFEPIANEKKLAFEVTLEPDAPANVTTDPQRVEQILKNLVSNALKFTEQGKVDVTIGLAPRGVSFTVRDTGIGIPAHQHELVFEAFRQADSNSNRKYGGTGLGLSISRDLARLLGGDLTLTSELGKGSTFRLTLPRKTAVKEEPKPPPKSGEPRRAATLHFDDDRDRLEGRRFILVIEDDPRFARILYDLSHERDFACVVSGEADEGFALAKELVPTAIVLDMNLPDHSGLTVLDRLKRDRETRHIPVHVVTVADYQTQTLGMGAAAFLQKPVNREQLIATFERLEERLGSGVRNLLVVEDDAVQRESLEKLLESETIHITAVGTVKEALAALAERTFDCVVTDLTLPDESGFTLLEELSKVDGPHPPVIVYTGRSLTLDEEQSLRRYSSSIIVKGARSPERLLDEVTLFLHQVEAQLPADRQRMLREVRDREAVLEGRTILVVEDDVRNIFALSSVLEPHGAKVIVARNGREGLEALEKNASVDLVLMDVMMPEMDGLTAMREIRKNKKWQKLPIVALTAKAMKTDQARCLEAGANDYISKPLDVEMLLSLLRIWLSR